MHLAFFCRLLNYETVQFQGYTEKKGKFPSSNCFNEETLVISPRIWLCALLTGSDQVWRLWCINYKIYKAVRNVDFLRGVILFAAAMARNPTSFSPQINSLVKQFRLFDQCNWNNDNALQIYSVCWSILGTFYFNHNIYLIVATNSYI